MINRILSYLNLTICDLTVIARALTSDMLRVHALDVYTLDEYSAKKELRTRYMQIAVESGLPSQAASRVADLAWAHLRDGELVQPTENESGFGFYK